MTGDGSRRLSECKTIQTFDSEIVRARAVLQGLIDGRNQLAPISRLIPELLCHIFHLTVFEEDQDLVLWDIAMSESLYFLPKERGKEYAPARRAILLTHVCHLWRTVARRDATLWTAPFMSSRRWCWRMLERIKEAPLHLFVNDDGSPGAYYNSRKSPDRTAIFCENLYASLQHLYRVRTLVLMFQSNAQYDDFANTALPLLSKPAPTLTTLSIVIKSRHDPVHTIAATGRLPPSIDEAFGDTPPPLRRLMLVSVIVPLSSPLLAISSLTSLFLHNVYGWKARLFNELTAVLDKLKRLCSLTVRNCIPDVTSYIANGEASRVSLPHLHTLALSDVTERCTALFMCISDIPQNANISLAVRMRSVPDFALVLSKISPSVAACRAAFISFPFPHYFSVQIYTEAPPSQERNLSSSGTPRITLTFSHDIHPELPWDPPILSPQQPISMLFNTLPLGSIEYVDLSGHGPHSMETDMWADVFTSFSNVTTLAVGMPSLRLLLDLHETPDQSNARIIFPLLHTLAVADDGAPTFLIPSTVCRLSQYISARTAAQGGNLRILDLRNVFIHKKSIADLENILEVRTAPISVAEVQFSSVRDPSCPSLNLNQHLWG